MATIKKRAPYRWQAKIRKKGYPHQSRTFETKREAEAWVAIIESEMARSVFVDRTPAESTTLEDVIDRYIREEAPRHKGMDTEIVRLEHFKKTEPDLCVRGMATLKTDDFEEFRDRRLKTLKPATVKRDLTLIQSAIQYSKRRLNLRENPVREVKRPYVRNERNVRFQGDDETRLMEALDTCRNPWIKPMAIIALETAMRRGEILSLHWDDVDLDQRFARLHDTKNGESRDVPLSTRAIETLQSLKRHETDKRVFPISAESIKNAFERSRKKADMTHFNFHDLRHEATSRLFEKGWNIMEVAAVTGHKDLQSLKRYTNLRATDLALKMG